MSFNGIIPSSLSRVLGRSTSNVSPFTSVIVTSFNYGKFLHAAVESVLAQTFSNHEVIVVDGGSTDGISPGIARQLDHPRVRVFYRKTPCLPGDNRNFGIARARGKYVCCLDADDTLEPTFLEKALFLAECGGYDIVSTNYRWTERRSEEVILPSRPSYVQCVGGAAMPITSLFTRENFHRIGRFRDTGKGESHLPEDWDFYIRATCLGLRMKNIQEPLLNVRDHGANLSNQPDILLPEYQRQALHRRYRKLLTFKSNKQFMENREQRVFRSRGLANLISGRAEMRTKCRLIVQSSQPDSAVSDLGLSSDLKNIVLFRTTRANTNKETREAFERIASAVFYLEDMGEGCASPADFLDFLFAYNRFEEIVMDSIHFNADDTTGILHLYDSIASV